MESNQSVAKDTMAIVSSGERDVSMHRGPAPHWSDGGFHQIKRIMYLKVLIRSERKKAHSLCAFWTNSREYEKRIRILI